MEELLEVHARAKGITRTGDHDSFCVVIVAQLLERRGHIRMQLGTHRILLRRPV